MSNPTIIPDGNIETPESSTGSVRPGEETLSIPADEPNKEIIVNLLSDAYPEAPTLGQFNPTMQNVDTFQLAIMPEGSTTWEILDQDGDGQPDVRLYWIKYIQAIID